MRTTEKSKNGIVERGLLIVLLFVSLNVSLALAAEIEFLPTDDAYTQNGGNNNNTTLRIESGVRVRISYLKFDLSELSGSVNSAALVLTEGGDNGVGPVVCSSGSHNDWDEATVSGATAPEAVEELDQFVGTVTKGDGSTYSFDVSLFITGPGVYSLIITSENLTGSEDIAFASKEWANAEGWPKLVVELTDLTKAHDPQPENRATGVSVDGLTLSWKAGKDPADPNNPNPNIIEHYLWASKPYDPMNPPLAGPEWDDPAVQQFTIGADIDPADGNVDPNASKAVPGLQKDSLYFWAVDEGLTGSSGPLETDPAKIIVGDTWFFETETTGPQVDAGDSVVTWLKAGTTTVDVNGTITDGTGDVTEILWSVVSSPPGSTVVIDNNSVEDTTATFTQTGQYVLQLYAKDATAQEDSDRIEVNVYSDSCEAAKNSLYGYTAPLYDFNNDCKEDFNDFAMFAARWLEDASLMSDVLYDAGEITLPVVEFTNPLDSSTVLGELIINATAYDPGVGTTDSDGMLGAGFVFFEIIDGSGTVLDTQNENLAPFDMTWNTANTEPAAGPIFPNGDYTIRVTAESDAGYQTIKEISVTVNNP